MELFNYVYQVKMVVLVLVESEYGMANDLLDLDVHSRGCHQASKPNTRQCRWRIALVDGE